MSQQGNQFIGYGRKRVLFVVKPLFEFEHITLTKDQKLNQISINFVMTSYNSYDCLDVYFVDQEEKYFYILYHFC